MSLIRRAKKRDTAEQPIIDALEAAGYWVWQIDLVDLLIWHPRWGPNHFRCLEVKTGTAKIRKGQTRQRNFVETTGAPIVRTPQQAIEALL